MRLGSAFWLRFEDSPAPFLRFGSLRFETCVLRLELRFGCVLKTVLHFSCVLKLRLELRFEPLRSAFALRGARKPGLPDTPEPRPPNLDPGPKSLTNPKP